MSFVWPGFLWLLLLVPLVLFGLWFAARRRERTAQAFADAHLLHRVVRRPGKALSRWTLLLQLAALTALLLAAARPVAAPPLRVNKAAVVIAFDASRSMLATDVEPSRLEAARALAERFVAQAPASTRIGLVSFSDVASVLVPPTTDRAELLDALGRIEPARNTSLAAAVVTGVRMLPGREEVPPPAELEPPGFIPPTPDAAPPPTTSPTASPPTSPTGTSPTGTPPPGSILILSDGVSNVSANPGLPGPSAVDIAARFAADNNVKLYTLPVGREGGAVTRIDGQDYFIPFEGQTLERLANRSEGDYLENADEETLRELFRRIGRVMRWERSRLEVSSLFSGLAVLLMLGAGGLSLRSQRRVV